MTRAQAIRMAARLAQNGMVDRARRLVEMHAGVGPVVIEVNETRPAWWTQIGGDRG